MQESEPVVRERCLVGRPWGSELERARVLRWELVWMLVVEMLCS